MIVSISGTIKRSYAEALCLLYFPGAKFPEGETPSPDVPAAFFESSFSDGKAVADVSLTLHGKTVSSHAERFLTERQDPLLTEKIAVGEAFLAVGRELTGRTPPWGILTGVRPAKVTSKYLAEGLSKEESATALSETYLVSPEKARLAAAVSVSEARMLPPDAAEACSVYIAIPFCPSRCSYCSFVSVASPRLLGMIPSYLEQLITEIHDTFALIRLLGRRVASVYIGGGTPTTLDSTQLDLLLGAIETEIDPSSLEEFTLEAGRPDTITLEKLLTARLHGVTRISVNPQTLNEDVLRHIGRKHTVGQFFEAYETALRAGIPNINVDLIAGLETDTAESFYGSIDKVLLLVPQNVTVHTFSVKRSADVLQENRNIYEREASDAEKSVSYSQSALLAAGYTPYYMYRQKNMIGNLENVGYAKPGHESPYNVYMMEEIHSIFGIGASAVTKLIKPKEDGGVAMERIFEPKYPYEYLNEDRQRRAAEKRLRILSFYGLI